MRVLGIGPNNGRLVELSHEEIEALIVQEPFRRHSDGPTIGSDVDIMSRLRPTIEFEKNVLFVPHAVEGIRAAALALEKAFAAIRKPEDSK